MLPIGPTPASGTPYDSPSAFAGDVRLISLVGLRTAGWLRRGELTPTRPLPRGRIDHAATRGFRMARLAAAFDRFEAAGGMRQEEYRSFCEREASWLADHALFSALRARERRPWPRWPSGLRLRRPETLARARRELRRELDFHGFLQFVFDRQWQALRDHCRRLGVGLVGDLPLFVAHDSADVWARPDLFRLGGDGWPRVVTGVPPDAFSARGQIWRHPHYDWPAHRREAHGWWVARVSRALERFDALRIDHFLGLLRAWEVPAGSRTARRGRWRPGPGADFFEDLGAALGKLPLIAEDLGLLTPAAAALRDRYDLPGMRVLQFGFGEDDSMHLPHRHPRHCVVYTSTHDNDTSLGWWRGVGAAERRRVQRYVNTRGGKIHWEMIRLAHTSVAELALVPMQDVLGLGSEARMNVPGRARGNWSWRITRLPGKRIAAQLWDLARATGRI